LQSTAAVAAAREATRELGGAVKRQTVSGGRDGAKGAAYTLPSAAVSENTHFTFFHVSKNAFFPFFKSDLI